MRRTTVGGSYASFLSDYSIEFDGVVDNLSGLGSTSLLSFVQNTGVFTLGAWIKLTDYTSLTAGMIMANLIGSADKGFYLAWDNRFGDRFFRISINRGGGNIVAFTSTVNSITDNNWHWVEAAGNGTTLTLYVDGVAKGTSGAFGTLSTGNSTRALMIGAEPVALAFPFYGRIHRTAIWNSTLNVAEMTAARTTPDLSTLSTYGNLVSWLRMGNNTNDAINGALGVNPNNRIYDMQSAAFATPSAAMVAANIVTDSPYP